MYKIRKLIQLKGQQSVWENADLKTISQIYASIAAELSCAIYVDIEEVRMVCPVKSIQGSVFNEEYARKCIQWRVRREVYSMKSAQRKVRNDACVTGFGKCSRDMCAGKDAEENVWRKLNTGMYSNEHFVSRFTQRIRRRRISTLGYA